ncbi:MAG: hypothetical protein ACOZDY_03170 [Pseudomonadota bacterium]
MFNYFWPLPGSADTTTFEYDPLDRLKQAIDPLAGQTRFGYTPLDQPASVTDPRNLVTSYTRNALDELTQQVSPDTGTTTNTYDPAGNAVSATDARGVVATATYDALNRLISQTFTPPGGSGIAPVAIAYGYDAGAHGKGRLTSVTDPSGTVVDYAFDAPGRIAGISSTPAGGSATTLLTGAAYHPSGAVKGYTHGNGVPYARSVDRDRNALATRFGCERSLSGAVERSARTRRIAVGRAPDAISAVAANPRPATGCRRD